jgi:gas vesicle protein
MSKATLWLIGLVLGLVIGVAAVALFAPATGREFRKRLNESYRETLAEAQRVSLSKQAELEADLARLQGKG